MVDWPSIPTSYDAVVVRVGATVAMYSFLGLPGEGPSTLTDSRIDGLVYDFVGAASAG